MPWSRVLPTFAEKSEIMGRYDRNRIYISAGQQERIRSYRVFIGGAVSLPPQLSVASSMLAGMCTDILFRLATGSVVKTFPKFYFIR